MAIVSGKRLGPYEILSAIGAGEMGEVYRARDTRLERIVAVKILPDHLSDRAELRERFEREARTLFVLFALVEMEDSGQQRVFIDGLLMSSGGEEYKVPTRPETLQTLREFLDDSLR